MHPPPTQLRGRHAAGLSSVAHQQQQQREQQHSGQQHPHSGHSHHHHSHGKSHSDSHSSGSQQSRCVSCCLRICPCIRMCCGRRRKLCIGLCTIMFILALAITLLVLDDQLSNSSGFFVRSFDDDALLDTMRETNRVECVDLAGSGGGVSFFSGLVSNLSMNHACQARDVWFRGDTQFERWGVVSPALTIVIPRKDYEHRVAVRRHLRVLARRKRGEFKEGADEQHEDEQQQQPQHATKLHHDDAPKESSVEEDGNVFTRTLTDLFGNYRKTFVFPKTPFGTRFVTDVITRSSISDLNASSSRGDFDVGVALLFCPHYTFKHPMHALEPLGTSISALQRWLSPAAQQDEAHHQHHEQHQQTVFASIDAVIIAARESINEASMQYSAIRAMLVGAYVRSGRTAEAALQIPIYHVTKKTKIFIKRLIVPGALYDIFNSVEQGVTFRQDLAHYIALNKSSESHKQMAAVPATAGQSKQRRRIVYMSRKNANLRKIVDEDAFVNFLTAVALAVDAEVLLLSAGKMTAVELSDAILPAQVMIGVHGADLANCVFLPTEVPAALIELNPFFFWEPRFFSLSRRLRIHYDAWNCRSSRCAFEGNSREFRKIMSRDKELKYNQTSGELVLPAKPNKKGRERELRAVWPVQNIVGESCRNSCDAVMSQTQLQPIFFTMLRSASIRVAVEPHAGEIARILFDSFVKVGWQKESDRAEFDHKMKPVLDAIAAQPLPTFKMESSSGKTISF